MPADLRKATPPHQRLIQVFIGGGGLTVILGIALYGSAMHDSARHEQANANLTNMLKLLSESDAATGTVLTLPNGKTLRNVILFRDAKGCMHYFEVKRPRADAPWQAIGRSRLADACPPR